MDINVRQSRQGSWRSRWSFVAAATGAAVGLGNLWKFSYLAGENGGAAFVFAYVLCVLFVAMPIMVAEVVLGSRGRSNPITSMQDVSLEAGASAWWQSIGWLGCVTGLVILSYYCVIAGWSIAYIEKMFSGQLLAASAQSAGGEFSTLLADPATLIKWQSLFLLIVGLVVAAGIRRGVAFLTRLLVPALLVMLIALVFYSSKVGDMDRALVFLFKLDLEAVTLDTLFAALGYAFFSLSLGVGTMLAYGAYLPDKRSVTKMVGTVVVMDTLISLLAGLAIFPLVFSLNLAPTMGPGLMFVALPYGFGNMVYGQYFGALFFVMASAVAVGSGVALLEPATAWVSEHMRLWRPVAVLVIVGVVWLLGLATIFSFNRWAGWSFAGFSLFTFLDFICANVLLPVGGLLTAVFVGWKMRKEVLRDELYVESDLIFSLWYRLLRYIAAPGVLVVFVVSWYQYLSS
ncbi:MAG: sodium-dependent transporter [Spongiibacteraceae bacterium]|nr:sodium-dependent transporter [Spongiibacteraceae bacterium]